MLIATSKETQESKRHRHVATTIRLLQQPKDKLQQQPSICRDIESLVVKTKNKLSINLKYVATTFQLVVTIEDKSKHKFLVCRDIAMLVVISKDSQQMAM